MKRALFALLLVSPAGATPPATPPGNVIGYTLDGFTLTLPAEAKICIEQPADRRDAKACAGVKMPTAGTAETDVVAHVGEGGLQVTVILHGGKIDPDPHGPMTRKYIDDNLGRGMENAQAQGVHVHGFRADDLYDLVMVGGVPAMRNIVEFGNKRLITYAVQGRTSLTSVLFYSDAAHLEAAKQLAERIMATVQVAPPKGASRGHRIAK